MKILIFVILFLSNLYSCSNSQNQVTENPVDWVSVQLFYECGPLPPQYRYDYSISINMDGTGNFACNLGYDKSVPAIIYSFKLSNDTIDMLDKAIKESKVLTEKIESMPENMHPIGGSISKVRIILPGQKGDSLTDRPPKVIETPEFPVERYKKDLEKLYDAVKSSVPKIYWDDLELKRKEFEANYKN